jgi:hypothetical protein
MALRQDIVCRIFLGSAAMTLRCSTTPSQLPRPWVHVTATGHPQKSTAERFIVNILLRSSLGRTDTSPRSPPVSYWSPGPPTDTTSRSQPATSGIQCHVSSTHIVPIFLYLSIGMRASIVAKIVGNPNIMSFHILSLLPGLGRILVIFYVMLILLSLGLTMRIG